MDIVEIIRCCRLAKYTSKLFLEKHQRDAVHYLKDHEIENKYVAEKNMEPDDIVDDIDLQNEVDFKIYEMVLGRVDKNIKDSNVVVIEEYVHDDDDDRHHGRRIGKNGKLVEG